MLHNFILNGSLFGKAKKFEDGGQFSKMYGFNIGEIVICNGEEDEVIGFVTPNDRENYNMGYRIILKENGTQSIGDVIKKFSEGGGVAKGWTDAEYEKGGGIGDFWDSLGVEGRNNWLKKRKDIPADYKLSLKHDKFEKLPDWIKEKVKKAYKDNKIYMASEGGGVAKGWTDAEKSDLEAQYTGGGKLKQKGTSDKKHDKDYKAKRVGYRYRDDFAKKHGLSPNAKPTQAHIEKYLGNGVYYEDRANRSDKSRMKKI